MKTQSPPKPTIPIGSEVPPYGKVGAVTCSGGERAYMFVKGGDVSLIPAAIVEAAWFLNRWASRA